MKKKEHLDDRIEYTNKQIENLKTLAQSCVPTKVAQVEIGKSWKYNDKTKTITIAPMTSDEGYDSAKGNLNHELSHGMYTNMRMYRSEVNKSDDKLFKEALNLVEDIYSETQITKKFGGADHFMAKSIEQTPEEERQKWISGNEMRQRLMYLYAKARDYDVLLDDLPDYSEMDDLVDALKEIKSSGMETVAAAREVAKRIRYEEDPPSDDKDEEGEGDGDGESGGESGGGESGEGDKDGDSKDKSSTGPPSESMGDGSEGPSETEEEFNKLPELDMWKDIASDLEKDVDKKALGDMKRWDHRLHWFTHNNMDKYRAMTHRTPSGSRKFDPETVTLTSRLMFRKVGDLFKNEARVRKLKGYKSGRLHGGSLHKIRHDDFSVFTRKKRKAKATDFAATILVDCSGSMCGGGKIPHARAATYSMAETLDRIGIKFNVVTFTSLKASDRHGADEPVLFTLKDFHEQWKGKDVNLKYIEAVAENYDGFCLFHAYKKLMQVQARNHIIFVISDGYPCPESHSVLEEVVREIQKSVIVVGFGLDFGGVKSFYKDHVVCEPERLPAETAKVLKRVLKLRDLRKMA